MKMNKLRDTNDYFLSEWIEGRITDEALKAKVSTADFEAYLKLRASLARLGFAAPDMEQQYRAIKDKKIASLDRKPKRIRLYALFSAVAALLLLFAMYQFFVFSNQSVTGYGQTTQLTLSDGSQVQLNNKSSVSYPNWFALGREISLQGEAFFKVSKGKTFTVQTASGNVTVLGTQFNVISREGYFEVSCYEGKVCVVARNRKAVLRKGQSIRFYQDQSERWEQPASVSPGWIRGESTFRNAPLEAVVQQFENQYHHKVVYPESLKSVRFTGSFTHNDLKVALRSICTPLQMRFDEKADGKIVFSK